LIVFHQFFTWIALGDVDLYFSLMLVMEANAVEEETTWGTQLHHQLNQSTHGTDGVTVTSLSASHPQKINVDTNHLRQTALNQKIIA